MGRGVQMWAGRGSGVKSALETVPHRHDAGMRGDDMLKTRIHRAAILASVVASAACAYPVTPFSVEKVASEADAVVIATLTHGVQTATGFTGILEV